MTDPFDSARRSDSVMVDEEGIRRERATGRYMLPVPGAEQRPEKPWTRATTFAKSISDTYILDKWGLRMAIKGMTIDKGLFALVASTPLPDKTDPETFAQRRNALDAYAEQAKTVAGAKVASSLGTALHTFTEQIDQAGPDGQPPFVPEPWDGAMAAYREMMAAEGFEMIPGLIERIVLCQRFNVAGKFDRILRLTRDYTAAVGKRRITLHAGEYVVGDLKTGSDLRYGWNEIAIQLAVYANADGIWDPNGWKYEPMPAPLRKDVAVVFHLPVDQAEAGSPILTLYDVDIETGWAGAELCESVRAWRSTRQLSSPHAVYEPPATESGPPATTDQGIDDLIERRPSWAERIRLASSRGELSQIRKEAMAAGEWTQELLRVGLARAAALDTA